MNNVLYTERFGRVLQITLDRPPANAINQQVSRELYGALRMLQDDETLSVGIITATGSRIFSAGWDLKEMSMLETAEDMLADSLNSPGGFAGITEFWDLYKPVIAAVNGMAVGGGFEIALAADVIVAAEHAQFFLPEMQRGFLPDAGAVQRLPRKVPYNVAMELMLTGRRMGAAEAKHWGLVHEVVPAEELLTHCRKLAQHIANGAPLAMQALKEVVPSIYDMPIQEAFAATKPDSGQFPIYQQMLSSEDFAEGARAFAEKRPPEWKGR